ncbi:lachesin-like [Bacillus rossius redtenbacheri]|uniref:lachesin-like n=1 Tax=Bacillus rossius redtenbacheri TaxID=93214 RepID=UPI002FDD2C6E
MERLLLRLLVPLLVAGPGAGGDRLPVISHVTQQQVADLGGSAELSCVVPHSQGYPVLWVRRAGALPLSTGCSRIVPDTRFKVACWRSRDVYTLTIEEVQETDAGYYECLVLLDSATPLAAETELVVRVPPFILDSSTRFAAAEEGGSVRLRCLAKGFPPPRLAWRRKDSSPLQGGRALHWGGELQLSNVSRADAGTYECVADNGVRRAARLAAAVQVSGVPRAWTPRPRQGQALRRRAHLLCLADAFPPPSVSWSRGGRPLADSARYSVSQTAGYGDVTASTLSVLHLERSQLGLYTCTATNRVGSHSVNLTLFETVNPTCPPSCDLR